MACFIHPHPGTRKLPVMRSPVRHRLLLVANRRPFGPAVMLDIALGTGLLLECRLPRYCQTCPHRPALSVTIHPASHPFHPSDRRPSALSCVHAWLVGWLAADRWAAPSLFRPCPSKADESRGRKSNPQKKISTSTTTAAAPSHMTC
jgi:hypothetical protein